MTDRSTDILVVVDEELKFLDRRNPKSLYNKVGKTMRECIDQIPRNTWPLVLDNAYLPFSGIDIKLKQRLNALSHSNAKAQIQIVEICDGICPVVNFYELLKNSDRLAWLVIPPKDYKETLEAAQELWLSRIFEILSLPIKDPVTGKADTRNASLILKAAAMIDLRKHGTPIQRIEQKNLNMNAELPTMEELDKQLQELEKPDGAIEVEFYEKN